MNAFDIWRELGIVFSAFKSSRMFIIIIIIIIIIMKEIAEQTGNREEAEKLRSELEELEEKASHLDKVRSKNLSAIRYGMLEIPL